MKQIILRLWLLMMWLFGLFHTISAQDTLCDPVQSATFSAKLNRVGDFLEVATRSIRTSNGQLAVAGYTDNLPASNYLPFFQLLDVNGTPVIPPQVIDLGGGFLNVDVQPFELQAETQMIEVKDSSGNPDGYLLAFTISGTGVETGESDVALIRLDTEGCPIWIRVIAEVADADIPIGLFQEDTGDFTVFIAALALQSDGNLSVVELDDTGTICNHTKITEINGDWQPMAVERLVSPLNAFAKYAVLSNHDRGGSQFGVALLEPGWQVLDGIISYFDMDPPGEDQSEIAYNIAQDAEDIVVVGNYGVSPNIDIFALHFNPVDAAGGVNPIIHRFYTYSIASTFDYPSDIIVDPLTHEVAIAFNVEYSLTGLNEVRVLKIDEFGSPSWIRSYNDLSTSSTYSFSFERGPGNSFANIGAHVDTSGDYSCWVVSTDAGGLLGDCNCYADVGIDVDSVFINQMEEEAFSNQVVCELIPVSGFCEPYDQEVAYCDRSPLLPEVCELDYCLTDTFLLNTGMNKADGSLYPFGTYDPFWRFISGPLPGLSTHPAYVISPNSAWAPLLSAGEVARYLSFIPYEGFSTNNPAPLEPYIFQNCFCVCADSTEVTIEMTLSSDDFAEVYLCDENNNLIDTILIADTTTNWAFLEPLTTDTLVTTLNAGTYCIKVELRNLGAVAMGFGVVGSVTGASVISELCCNNGSAIVGAKFHDLDCDGERGEPNNPDAPEHEPGLPGWGIVLCDSLGNPLDTTYTDTLGYYSFEFLLPGKYRVKELMQPDWVQTYPDTLTYWEVMLDSIDVAGFIDFGNKYTGPLAFRDSIECAKRGSRNPITWEGGECDCPVNIDAVNCVTGAIMNLATGLPNTGVFYWNVSATFPIGDYQIVITNCDGNDVLSSECFPIRDCCCGDVYPSFTVSQSCDGIIVTPSIDDGCFQLYWDWGDGSPEEGPYAAGTTISHDYSDPDAYVVCLRLEEFDDFGEFCREIRQCRLISFEGCPPECDSLEVRANPIDTANNQCCWSLDYTNTYPDSGVYAIEVLLPGGATLVYDPATDIAAPFNRFTYSNQHVLLINDNFDPLPTGSVTDFFSFCIAGVAQTPQQVIINWYDEDFNIVCDEILLLDCQPETEECLYILTDTLICDTAGYKYIATVKNPLGSGFDVGLIKLNVLNPLSGITVPDSIVHIIPQLSAGDTMMLMWVIETDDDLAGEDFCFLLSAHDGPDEMLCCAEIEKCIPFPQCDPCEYVDVMAMPLDTIIGGDCCYTFTVKNGYFDPMYFTGFQVNILNPGVDFSGLNVPTPPAWWYVQSGPGQLEWTHFSGFIPVDTLDVFDFCIEGVTTTDSVYMEVNWLQGDSIVCYDTLAVYCPECIVITEDTVTCQPDGTYKYTFNFTNLNDLNVPVNAIKVIDTTGYVIMPDSGEYILLPTPVPYGQTSTSDPMIIIDAPDSLDIFCFKMVMTYLDEDSINVECCYVEHCIELPPCGDPCPQFGCIPPNDLEFFCSELPPGIDYNDPIVLQQFFGIPEVTGDCPDLSWEELPPIVNLDDCGGGVIIRAFQAIDGAGNTSEICEQTIVLLESHEYLIRFPGDGITDCIELGGQEGLLLEESACDMLAVTYEDAPFDGGNGCLQIARTYRVINWCIYDGTAAPVIVSRDEDCDGIPGDEDVWVNVLANGIAYIDRNSDPFDLTPTGGEKGNTCDGLTNPGGYWISTTEGPGATPPRDLTDIGFWQYTQFIEVIDNTPPVIQADTAQTFCSFDNINCTADIELLFSVVDDCALGDILITQVDYDQNSDGTIDADVTGTVIESAPDYVIAGTYPIGSHLFIIRAEDACGNVAIFNLPFEVVDCAPPDIVCQATIVAQLLPVTPPSDVDGDGDIDVASATVPADALVQGLIFDCTGQGPNGEVTQFSINIAGNPVDPLQNSLILTCDEVGLVQVEVHAYDGAGNTNTCLSAIFVQDNIGLCGPVAEVLLPDRLQTYPNPVKEILHLLPPLEGSYQLEAFDARGTLLYSRQLDFDGTQPIDVPVKEWSDGLYFFKLSHSGGEVYESRAVKTK